MTDKLELEIKEQTVRMLISIARTVQVVAVSVVLLMLFQFVLQLHL